MAIYDELFDDFDALSREKEKLVKHIEELSRKN